MNVWQVAVATHRERHDAELVATERASDGAMEVVEEAVGGGLADTASETADLHDEAVVGRLAAISASRAARAIARRPASEPAIEGAADEAVPGRMAPDLPIPPPSGSRRDAPVGGLPSDEGASTSRLMASRRCEASCWRSMALAAAVMSASMRAARG